MSGLRVRIRWMRARIHQRSACYIGIGAFLCEMRERMKRLGARIQWMGASIHEIDGRIRLVRVRMSALGTRIRPMDAAVHEIDARIRRMGSRSCEIDAPIDRERMGCRFVAGPAALTSLPNDVVDCPRGDGDYRMGVTRT